MKSLKSILVSAVCCTMMMVAPKAFALKVLFGYYFTADPGQSTDLNGSSIVLEPSFYNNGVYLVNWNLEDTGLTTLNINNSTISFQSFTGDSDTNWEGSFTIAGLGETFTGNDDGMAGSLDVLSDPPGVWTALGQTPIFPSVPDSTSTLALLLAVVGALVFARRHAAKHLLALKLERDFLPVGSTTTGLMRPFAPFRVVVGDGFEPSKA